VRTKALNYRSFIQHLSKGILYITKDDDGLYDIANGATTFTSGETEYIAFPIDPAVNDGLGYEFKEGDMLYAFSSDEATYPDPFVFPLAGQVGSYVIAERPQDMGDTGSLGVNEVMLIEIMTPRKPLGDEFFYETGGRMYMVDNPGTPTRYYSVTAGSIKSGDIYVKRRDLSAINVGLTDFKLEAMSPNDEHWSDWQTDIGRPNIVIRDSSQESRTQQYAYSNRWLPGSKVNGLSQFDALDYGDLDERLGPIQKLVVATRTQQEGTFMLAVGTSGTASMYLGETQIIDNNDGAIIASSGQVVGTVNELKGGYGTTHPESVVENDGKVYWFDRLSGKVIRYAGGGMYPISNYKMSKFFLDISKLVSALDMPATYDDAMGQYMLTIPFEYEYNLMPDYNPSKVYSPHGIWGNSVLVFRDVEGREGWVCEYTLKPTWMSTIGNKVVSFKKGSIYIHDDAANRNTFFGVTWPSVIGFVINAPVGVKVPESISIEGDRSPDWVHIKNSHPYEQSTDIETGEFTNREGVYYSTVYRDRNTPGFASAELAWYSGDKIRGRHLEVAVQWDVSSAGFEMYAMHFAYYSSIGHKLSQ